MKLAPLVPLLVLAAGVVAVARPPSTAVADAAVHVVTYLDVLPPETDAARTLLARQTVSERGRPGCRSSELLQEQGRPNHFMRVEAWDDAAGLEAYHATAEYRAFRAALQPTLGSPLDERRARQVDPPDAGTGPK